MLRRLEVEAVERVGAQVGEEDVRRGEQLLEPVPGLGLAQVEDDAALAPVVLREGGVREVLADPERSEGVAHRIAVRRLDLDDVGAPVRQEGGRRGRGDPHADLDHAQVGQCGEPVRVPVSVTSAPRRVPRRPAPAASSFITFPVAFSGSSSTISTTRGHLVVRHLARGSTR